MDECATVVGLRRPDLGAAPRGFKGVGKPEFQRVFGWPLVRISSCLRFCRSCWGSTFCAARGTAMRRCWGLAFCSMCSTPASCSGSCWSRSSLNQFLALRIEAGQSAGPPQGASSRDRRRRQSSSFSAITNTPRSCGSLPAMPPALFDLHPLPAAPLDRAADRHFVLHLPGDLLPPRRLPPRIVEAGSYG